MYTIVIIDPSTGLGGAETLTYRIVKYLYHKNDFDVILITHPQGLAKQLLEKENIDFRYEKYPLKKIGVGYLSSKDMENLRNIGSKIIGNKKNVTIIASYFNNLQAALLLFKDKNVNIFSGFFHPEAWTRTLYPSFSGTLKIRSKKINKLWYYQKKLLETMNMRGGLWFLNDYYRKYNEFYYNVNLNNTKIIPIPFDFGYKDKINKFKPNNEDHNFSVIWLGRFEYFKNPSIKKTFFSLERLALKYKYLNIKFHLIGYGREKYDIDLKDSLKSKIIDIKFLGKVDPDQLPNILSKYNIGVAMGTSALHMGSAGLPTIIIDGADERHSDFIKAIWLYKAPVGYLGTGVYMDTIGEKIKERKEIENLLEDAIENKMNLTKKGDKCKSYVKKNYDSEKIIPKIIESACASNFMSFETDVYRHPLMRVIARRLVAMIR